MIHRPLVLIDGVNHQLPQGDSVVGLAAVDTVPSLVIATGATAVMDSIVILDFAAVEWLVTAWSVTTGVRRTLSVRASVSTAAVEWLTHGAMGSRFGLGVAVTLTGDTLRLAATNHYHLSLEAGAVRQYLRV